MGENALPLSQPDKSFFRWFVLSTSEAASTSCDNSTECFSSLTPTSSSSPLTSLPSSAAANAESRMNRGINLLNFVFPDPVPPSSCFSSLSRSLSFWFCFPGAIPDAFRLNALPLTPGLSKPEPIPLPSSFHPVISPPEVNFQFVPDVVCQLVLAAVGKDEEEPVRNEDEAVREDEKEEDNCPREGSLPLDRWRVGDLASTQISQPVWRCRGQRNVGRELTVWWSIPAV